MEEEKTGPPIKITTSQRGLVNGAVVIGALFVLGFFIWPGRIQSLTNANSPGTSTETSLLDLPPIDTIAASLAATNPPEPATPTAISTSAQTSAVDASVLPVATVTATPTASATFLPTITPVIEPSAAEQITTNSSETAVPSATPIPWPTTNPTLLPKPPTDLDLSRGHLWFSRPVQGNSLPASAYRFGMTFNQRLVPHRAVDIANEEGTPVVAIGPGTVLYAGEDQEQVFGPQPAFYGQVVVIEMEAMWEGHPIYALYGHLNSVAVTSEQTVKQGDVVGTVGSSGVAIAAHLHFEVRQDDPYSYDSVRNPELWYWPLSNNGVLAGRVIDARGYFLPGTRVEVECRDGAPRYVETYWDQYTPPDDILMENFVISDLPAGTCRVWSDLFGEIVEDFIEIHPGELNMVVLQARS